MKLIEKKDRDKRFIQNLNFNLIFDCKFDASGGNPILKKNL